MLSFGRRLRLSSGPGLSSSSSSLSLSCRSVSRFLSSGSGSGSSVKVKARFDPKKILPHEYKHVRVIGNTSRDAQQSNVSAEMAHEHRVEIAKLIDAVYADMDEPRGYEQIWGGTVPMFDIWKRGVQPFDSIRAQVAYMPHTPASALIRGQALVAMGAQPTDVIDAFIKHSVDAGVDVYTTFDAHNDVRNHKDVAEAVHKYGGHYQGCLSYAVYNADPTIYNVGWAVNFFREVVALGAHSLYIKDPSGVLTPEMARAMVSEVKAAFPNLPLVIHTHYQTGYAYMTYLEAVKAGANGVETSFGFADGAGQPYGLSMLRTFEDLGFHTGRMSKPAIAAIDAYCKTIRPLYSQSVVRTPDLAVENNGIAGGQRTILEKECLDAGQPGLIPKIETMVAAVRAKGGRICQVTPVADAYARESMRRLRGGPADRNFAPGYASMLRGEWGALKEPVIAQEQAQALLEKGIAVLKEATANKQFTEAQAQELTANNNKHLCTIREQSASLRLPHDLSRRISELTTRLSELAFISSKPDLLESINRKIAVARDTDDKGNVIQNLDQRIKLIKEEVEEAKAKLASVKQIVTEEEYEALYLGTAPESRYAELKSSASPALPSSLTVPQYASLFGALSFISGASSRTLAPGMPSARKSLAQFDEANVVGLTSEGERLAEESAVLFAVFGKSVVPNMLENFFLNYREKPSFWPPTYKRASSSAAAVKNTAPEFLTLSLHSTIERAVGPATMTALIDSAALLNKWSTRLSTITKTNNSNIAPETIARIRQRIDTLKSKHSLLRQSALTSIRNARIIETTPTASLPQYDAEGRLTQLPQQHQENKFMALLDSFVNNKAKKA